MIRKTTCPVCLKAIEFDNQRGGRSIACPHCAEPVRLPEAIAEPSPPPQTLDYASVKREREAGDIGAALILMIFIGGVFMFAAATLSMGRATQGAASICRLLGWLVFILAFCLGLVGGFKWPIHVANRRNHPQREAIRIAALCGLLILPFWMVACIWAHTVPEPEGPISSE